MKSTKKQSGAFVMDSTILFVIGIAFFSLSFFVGNILSKKALGVPINDVIPNIPLLAIGGAYLFTSIMFGVDTVEAFIKKQKKGFRIFAWIIFPITYLIAMIIGVVAFIPVFITRLGSTLFGSK